MKRHNPTQIYVHATEYVAVDQKMWFWLAPIKFWKLDNCVEISFVEWFALSIGVSKNTYSVKSLHFFGWLIMWFWRNLCSLHLKNCIVELNPVVCTVVIIRCQFPIRVLYWKHFLDPCMNLITHFVEHVCFFLTSIVLC